MSRELFHYLTITQISAYFRFWCEVLKLVLKTLNSSPQSLQILLMISVDNQSRDRLMMIGHRSLRWNKNWNWNALLSTDKKVDDDIRCVPTLRICLQCMCATNLKYWLWIAKLIPEVDFDEVERKETFHRLSCGTWTRPFYSLISSDRSKLR